MLHTRFVPRRLLDCIAANNVQIKDRIYTMRTGWIKQAYKYLIQAFDFGHYGADYVLKKDRFMVHSRYYEHPDKQQYFFTAPIGEFLTQSLLQRAQLARKSIHARRRFEQFLSIIDGPLICFAYTTLRGALEKKDKGMSYEVTVVSQRELYTRLMYCWRKREDVVLSRSGPQVTAADCIKENIKAQVIAAHEQPHDDDALPDPGSPGEQHAETVDPAALRSFFTSQLNQIRSRVPEKQQRLLDRVTQASARMQQGGEWGPEDQLVQENTGLGNH